jgi:uncharacterized protein (TIGR02246 family)
VRGTWCVAAVLAACSDTGRPVSDPQREIGVMLAASAAAWNRGDLDGFMDDYARDSLTSYVSGGSVIYGWQTLYDRYQARYFAPGKPRDSLAFDDVRVRALEPDVAFGTARFALYRGDSLVASGPFTIVLQRQGDRWRIIHDHTSSDPKP